MSQLNQASKIRMVNFYSFVSIEEVENGFVVTANDGDGEHVKFIVADLEELLKALIVFYKDDEE